MIQQVAEGKRPYPTDPMLAAMYEVQVFKFNRDNELRKINPDGTHAVPQPTDEELADQKKQDQATALRIAGDLFILPKNQRMAALIKLPVPDRIAFTTYLAGDQQNLLLADFSPREREIFNAMAANIGSSYQIINELSQAKFLRAILSERQLQEVMTDFWFNHFNIYIAKDSDQWYTTTYERDAIRQNALGKFRDLLLATAQSPAMMVYLDNWSVHRPRLPRQRSQPRQPQIQRKANRGLNENYGSEVMELHTVGVNGGYTQADVTSLSAILTGWAVDRPNQAGPFLFDPKKHEPGPKQWFGHTIDERTHRRTLTNPPAPRTESMKASPPSTSSPPTQRQRTSSATNRPTLRRRRPAPSPRRQHGHNLPRHRRRHQSHPPHPRPVSRVQLQKVLPQQGQDSHGVPRLSLPHHRHRPANPGALVNTIKTMGMPLYYALPPTGYYITADQWMNSTALVDRLNFAYQLTSNKFANQKFDSAHVLAFGLMAQPATNPGAPRPAPSRGRRFFHSAEFHMECPVIFAGAFS